MVHFRFGQIWLPDTCESAFTALQTRQYVQINHHIPGTFGPIHRFIINVVMIILNLSLSGLVKLGLEDLSKGFVDILGAPNELFHKKAVLQWVFPGKIDPVLCFAGKVKYICWETFKKTFH